MCRILRALKWMAIVVVVLAIGLSAYVAMYWDRTWDVPEPDLHASTDPAVIARGEYIVYGPAHCTSVIRAASSSSSASSTTVRRRLCLAGTRWR